MATLVNDCKSGFNCAISHFFVKQNLCSEYFLLEKNERREIQQRPT